MKTVDGTELYREALEKINELLEENAELRAKLGLALAGKAIHHIDGNACNNDPANLRIVDIDRERWLNKVLAPQRDILDET